MRPGCRPSWPNCSFCRGIDDPRLARDFLDARLASLRDPEELPGVSAAAERIMAAIAAGRRIVIYGDYDVDGMSGTALLYLCLRMLGGRGQLLRAAIASTRATG